MTVVAHKFPIKGFAGKGQSHQSYATTVTACSECGLNHVDQEATLTLDGQYVVHLCPNTQTHAVTPIASATIT